MADELESEVVVLERIATGVAEPQPMEAATIEELLERIHELEERERELQKQVVKSEADFGVSRARFKDVLVRKEESQKEALDALIAREQSLQAKVSRLEAELDDARSLVVVAECTKEDAIEMERRKHSGEVASLQSHIAELRAYLKELKKERDGFESELSSMKQQWSARSQNDLFPAALTQVSKIAKRVGGALTHAASAESFPVSTESEETELSKSAQHEEETTLLNSMGEEIRALKEKLREVDGRCQSMQAVHDSLVEGHSMLFEKEQGVEFFESAKQRLGEVIEGGSRSTQIGVFLSIISAEKVNAELEAQRLKAQMTEVNLKNGREMRELRNKLTSAEKEAQMLKSVLDRTRSLLTDEQRRAVDDSEHLQVEEGVGVLAPSSSTGSLAVMSGGDAGVFSSSPSQVSLGGSTPARSDCARCVTLREDLVGRKEKEKSLTALVREATEEKKKLEATLERCKEDLLREGRYRHKMEEEWNAKVSLQDKKFNELRDLLDKEEAKMKQLGDLYEGLRQSALKHLKRLSEKRTEAQNELTRLQSENETLLGSHFKNSDEVQSETISLPNKPDELQLFLLKLREEMIAAKVAKEFVECRLENEITRKRMEAGVWKRDKESLETQVEEFRSRLSVLGRLEAELSEESEVRKKLEEDHAVAREADRKVIEELKLALQKMKSEKDSALNTVDELRIKVSSLQEGLENTETVQRDFVHLTQSLQRELEKIRQSDTEVRWVSEEDVHSCFACSAEFGVTRRKHHCRHCGKIFCAECLTRSVPSGTSRRLAKVCDVCHTILNKDVAPYFSTKPPKGD